MPRCVPRQQWLSEKDEALCLRLHQVSRIHWLRKGCCVVSRLSNGVFWYTLMIALLVFRGPAAVQPVLHMVVTGLACTLFYKWLKAKTNRKRPYHRNEQIQPLADPLDEYSFPSGHTLHAVAFSVIALYYYPVFAAFLLPFTVLVALSRVVVGLHYPSDVLAGIAIGSSIASVSLLF